MSEVPLDQRIEQNRYAQDVAQTERNRQRDQQRQEEQNKIQQAEKEYQEYLKNQAEYQKQLEQLEAEERKRAESEIQKQYIQQKYSTLITDLTAQRDQAFQDSKKDNSFSYQPLIKSLNARIDQARKDQSQELHYLEYSATFGDRPLTQPELRSYNAFLGSKYEKSLVDVVNIRQASRDAQTQYNIQSSIKSAQSDAIKEREKLEFTIRAFEEAKDKSPQPQNITNVLAEYKLTQGTKTKPGVYPSTYFKDMTDPTDGRALSIIGTSEQQSRLALKTFDETEREQKELYDKITLSKDFKETIDLKSRYQDANPYVGTPQTYIYKGGITHQQGVLIEKKLSDKFSTDKINVFSPIANPNEKLQEVIETTIERKEKDGIPYYSFLDDKGNVKQVTEKELWDYVTKSIQQGGYERPSKTDIEINKYLNENMDEITDPKTINESGETIPLIDTKKPGIASGFLGHANELYAVGHNLLNPKDEIEYDPTLESYGFQDIFERGRYLFLGDADLEKEGIQVPKESQFIKEVQSKLEQPGGAEYLIASGITSGIIGLATAILPPVAFVKYGKYFVQPKTMKEAEQIAQALTTKSKQTLSPELQAQISKKVNKEIPKPQPSEPYGVELISKKDPTRALITLGTETAESATPYIVYARKGKSSVYSVRNKEKPITPTEIIVKGQQAKELTDPKVLQKTSKKQSVFKPAETGLKGEAIPAKNVQTTYTESITSYPPTRGNVDKILNDKIELVGTKKDVLSKDLKQYPKEVVSNIQEQEIKRESILLETEAKNPQKSIVKDLEGKSKPGSLDETGRMKKEMDSALDTTKSNIGTGKTARSYSEGKFSIADKPPTTPPKSQDVINLKKSDPVQSRKEQLKEFAKDLAKSEQKSDINVYSASVLGMSSAQGIRLSGAQQAKTATKQAQDLVSEKIQITKQGLESLTGQAQLSKEIIIEKIKENELQKPWLSPRWSLIVSEGTKQETGLVPKVIITQKEELITKLDDPNPRPDIPGDPVIKIPGGKIDIEFKEKERKEFGAKIRSGKLKWIWNVDTVKPGVYLPTRDLSVGRTQKTITRVERLQKRTHKQSYIDRLERKRDKFMRVDFREKKTKVSTPKTDLRFISKPKGKEAKKFLKRFNVKI